MPFAPRSANPPRASPLVACSRFLPRLWALVLYSVWQRRTASDLASTSLEALREPPVFPTHLVLLTTVENRNRLSRTLSLSRLFRIFLRPSWEGATAPGFPLALSEGVRLRLFDGSSNNRSFPGVARPRRSCPGVTPSRSDIDHFGISHREISLIRQPYHTGGARTYLWYLPAYPFCLPSCSARRALLACSHPVPPHVRPGRAEMPNLTPLNGASGHSETGLSLT